ncbi:TlpA family protein disulfide reductase [Parapedobacter koreensis]|uniref:Thiol-disulfide isomerase or thioredoxin n=1 Tax=Parapedobacter koreensis TaxID=332977 RepID=A0A1H7GAY7_9SPHI|nr:TlpA disulfide reductase family protein [Parapedobacter koreensis]SEK35234.1 Thiol-disulfide isomerase or thioredoxin [Parapedobacter koreensis]
MKKLSFFFILIACLGCESPQPTGRVRIHGEFPPVAGAYLRLAFYRQERLKVIETPLKQGKFDFYLDSAVTGVYNFSIKWPVPERNRFETTRDANGQIIRKKFPPHIFTRYILRKELYINPVQATTYHIAPEKEITMRMIDKFTTDDYDRPDLFRLKLTTTSADARYYETLDSLKKYHYDMNIHLISDSIRRHMAVLPKGNNAVLILAEKINAERNISSYLRARRNLARRHPDNPVAALDILEVSNEQLLENLNDYTALLDDMEGRARESEYHTLARSKLAGLANPLKEGALFELPEGKTPSGENPSFRPEDSQYTLVEFWASWCIPCREQNPAWNNLSARYGNRGFRILGVSLDSDTDSWLKAIADDKLSGWLHLSDYGAFKGMNAVKYGIQSIPYNVLIDSNGRVAEQHITPEQLDEFLDLNLAKH